MHRSIGSRYISCTIEAGLFFQPNELHGPVALALLSYLSFPCFKDEFSKAVLTQYPRLEYACCQLIWHVTKVNEGFAECIERLAMFFHSKQGWQWLQRLTNTYDLSIGHQQVLQAQLKLWLKTIPADTIVVPDRDIFQHLLLRLGEKRLAELTESADSPQMEIIETLSDLSLIHRHHRQWRQSEELLLQVLDTRKMILGDEHPETLTSMDNPVSTYWHQGRWKEAEALEAQDLETKKRVLGQEHPDTLMGMRNLAMAYLYQDQWNEAEELLPPVLETSKRVLGKEHPDTLGCMAHLVSTYCCQERWNEANERAVYGGLCPGDEKKGARSRASGQIVQHVPPRWC